MSNVFSSSYPISRSPGVCGASGRAFIHGERVIATLVLRQEELSRMDYSTQAWGEGVRPSGLFAHWSTVFQPGADTKKGRLSDEEALELFEQLDSPQSPAQEAFRFVLALFLVRRRLFVYEGSKDGVIRVRVRTRAEEIAAPVVEVREVSMKDESLAGAFEQLKDLIPDPAGQN